jgi:hypothetical protein
MKIKVTEKLREVETLYKRIECFAPTNDVEKRTRQLLLELARAPFRAPPRAGSTAHQD